MIIAIDGPAGAGKSTVAKLTARKLDFLYIDTGAMYRAVTLKVLDEAINPFDETTVIGAARRAEIDLIQNHHGPITVLLDGRDVSSAIREPRITKHVSDVAKIKGVREIMVQLQRSLGNRKDSVLDGRDIGTVVFPEADKKFYLDARFSERVARRYKELKAAGQEVLESEVAADLRNRDTIDSTRAVSPLRRADDAIYIDTTDLTIEQVVENIFNHIKSPRKQTPEH